MTEKLDWRTLKPGDRVRVTLEGEMRQEMAGVSPAFMVDTSDGGRATMTPFVIANATTIERIEKPLEVGDRVQDRQFPDEKGAIIAFTIAGIPVVEWDKQDPDEPAVSAMLSCNLERAQ